METPASLSNDPPRVRRRGRPRKLNDTDKSTVNRRERNREAQRIHKARKVAERSLDEARIFSLESSVGQLGSVLTDLVDKILSSEAAILDRMLLEETQESIHRFLHILSPKISPKLSSDSIIPDVHQRLTQLQKPLEPRPSSRPGNGQIQLTPSHPVSSTASYPVAVLESVDSLDFKNNFPVVNVFGNGWASDLALPFVPQRPRLRPNSEPSPNLSEEIVRSTLLHAYDALVKARDTSERTVFQTFGLALRYYSKEELLYTLRWFLGPGHQQMHRLTGLNLQQEPIRQANTNAFSGQISAPSDYKFWNSTTHFDPADSNTFVSADEVVSSLASWGAVNTDRNTIKLWVDDLKDAGADNQDVRFPPSKMNFWDGNLFFPSAPPSAPKHLSGSNSPNMQPISISQTLLFRHLGEISACLLSGPAFRKELLRSVIIASVIYT